MLRFVNRFCFSRVSQIAVFNTKKYDIEFFDKANSSFPAEQQSKLHYFTEELNEKTLKLAAECNTVCCFVNDKITGPVLRKLHLQGIDLVALRCAGFNNVDLKEAEKLNVKVVRVPAYSPEAVAEFSMALLLALNRKIHKAYNRTRDHNFALDGLIGTNLFGKTIGIVGTGKIGICMVKICKGFGMKVIAFDVHKNEELAKQLGFTYVDESELFYNSDFISLHCPLTPQTKHIINDHSLLKMKDNVMIVNTGRGALIESRSVVNALKKKKIAGLALDVYEQEERLFFKDISSDVLTDDVMARLLSFPNVILTGHQAFFTDEAIGNICHTTLNNINDIRSTGELINYFMSNKKFNVDSIVDKRIHNGVTEYRIRWKGYTADHDTWESKNVKHLTKEIIDYEIRQHDPKEQYHFDHLPSQEPIAVLRIDHVEKKGFVSWPYLNKYAKPEITQFSVRKLSTFYTHIYTQRLEYDADDTCIPRFNEKGVFGNLQEHTQICVYDINKTTRQCLVIFDFDEYRRLQPDPIWIPLAKAKDELVLEYLEAQPLQQNY